MQCSKENLARCTRDLIEYYFASRGEEIKVGRGFRRKTKGGVAEGRTCSLAPRNDPRRYIFRYDLLYILLSNNNADSLLSIIDRMRTAYPRISWSINEAALRDRERTKLISHHSAESHRSNGRNRKISANESLDESIGSVRNSRPNDACPAAQHSFVRERDAI